MFQFTIVAGQWKSTDLDANQLYKQALEQYVLSYYNYLNQQDFILNNQNLNYPNNIVHTDPPKPTNIQYSNPINALKIENITTNEKQTTAKPTLLRRNKILLPRTCNIKPIKPIKSKLRSILLHKNS